MKMLSLPITFFGGDTASWANSVPGLNILLAIFVALLIHRCVWTMIGASRHHFSPVLWLSPQELDGL